MSAATALDAFFDEFYRRRPVTATFTGVHAHDYALPDWSPEGRADLLAGMRRLRTRLDDAGRVPDAAVSRLPDEVDLALADAQLEIEIAEHESGHFYTSNPALWTGEAIFSVLSLVTRPFAPLDARLAAASARMRAMPAFVACAERSLTGAPDEWRAKAERECRAAEMLFGRSLPDWIPASGASLAAAHEAVRACRVAVGAFDAFAAFLRTRLPTLGAGGTSAGRAMLSLLLRRGHWCTTSIDALDEEAAAALDGAHAALDAHVRGLGEDSWAGVLRRLAAERPAAEDYLPRFARIWQACYEHARAHDLVTWPDAPIRYVPIPEHTRDAAPLLYYLFYRSPAAFDRLPIHDYVVTPIDGVDDAERERRLSAANDSAITLNHVIHHGGLGHHVQNWYAYRSPSRIGQVAAIDASSRIAMFGGGTMAEGWACYACDLMEETGFLTPLHAAAQQHTRVRLLARAVADIRLHTGRMTLDQTAAFYEARGLMAPAVARAEAVKNSMFPGAAVMYWLGTRGIHDLRTQSAAREGARFSLRRFHDRFLSFGAIPVALTARQMLNEARA